MVEVFARVELSIRSPGAGGGGGCHADRAVGDRAKRPEPQFDFALKSPEFVPPNIIPLVVKPARSLNRAIRAACAIRRPNRDWIS